MSPAELKARLSDRWWRLNHLYWIEDEHGKAIQFKPRPLQTHFYNNIWYWNNILKARQLGFSTFIDILILDSALFISNQRCGIIAHTRDDAEELFRTKIKFAYDNLPEQIRAARPADTSRAQQLVFSNGSSIKVGTSMRSGTIQWLHISEYGKICAKFPEKAKEVRTGSFPAVHEGSYCFIESTAEGVGGDFYDLCLKSMNHTGKLNKKQARFHFYAWFDDPKYAMTPAEGWIPDERVKKYLDEKEKETGTTFTPEQRYWYEVTESTYGTEMPQEYPTTPVEAFLFSGRVRFPSHHIALAKAECMEPKHRYQLTTHSLLPDDNGKLEVWYKPEPDMHYAIGVDVAEGLVNNDYSVFHVVDRDGYQVAKWHGHVEPDQLGSMVDKVGRFYNNALVGVERNNHGLTTITRLRDLNYPNQFIQKDPEHRAGEKLTKKIGWLTTSRTKPLMIDHLAELLRDECHGIACHRTVSEFQTYVIDDAGKTNAQDGCYDDEVTSYAIAQQMRLQLPKMKRAIPQSNFQPGKAGYA